MITGVHLTPALAVLDELQSRGYNNFIWVGRKQPYILGTKEESLEYKIIKERGIPFINLITGKLQRTIDLSFFRWIIRIPVGFVQAFFVILKHKPAIVVTFGSYVGVPISFWAWIFGIKIIVHEQVLVGGLANSIISKFANIVCLSWNTSHKDKKYIYTGNPIQKNILESTTDVFNFAEPSRPTLLFMAGKAGSHKLNLAVLSSVKKLSKRFNIIHQTGSNPIANDLAEAEKIALEINKDGIKYIPVIHYLGGEVYKKSQIVIARSGANTVYELAALGKIAIFVPIPFTRKNEQIKNAELLESVGTAKILHENILTPDTLISTIEEVEANYDSMKSNINKARALVTLDADKRIADVVEGYLISKNKKVDVTQIIHTDKDSKTKKKYFPHPNLEALNKLIDIRKNLVGKTVKKINDKKTEKSAKSQGEDTTKMTKIKEKKSNSKVKAKPVHNKQVKKKNKKKK